MKPVQILYHGTSLDYVESIDEKGLVSDNNKVYLTADVIVAYDYALKAVQKGYSLQPVICVVNAPQMVEDGFIFEHDNVNAEFTVNNIPAKYIIQIAVESEDDLELLVHYAQEQVFCNRVNNHNIHIDC